MHTGNHAARLTLTLALLLTACEQADKNTAEKLSDEKPAGQTAEAASPASSEPQPPASPNAGDIASLSRVMHGAVNQQPDDAPKDKYGDPYIIGDLGGVPVNLPASIVRLVEYDDSPGWDMNKVRTYNPPVRNYQSKIAAFGFTFRNRDALFLDRSNREINQAHDSSRSNRDNDWIRVSISSAQHYGEVENLYGKLLQDNLSSKIESVHYVPKNENVFGLEVYINPHIDPRTQRPWREFRADDIYIARDAVSNVRTYITCATVDDVPTPQCAHSFEFPPPMKIRLRMGYNRRILSQWQSIEDNAIKMIYSFSAKTAK